MNRNRISCELVAVKSVNGLTVYRKLCLGEYETMQKFEGKPTAGAIRTIQINMQSRARRDGFLRVSWEVRTEKQHAEAVKDLA